MDWPQVLIGVGTGMMGLLALQRFLKGLKPHRSHPVFELNGDKDRIIEALASHHRRLLKLENLVKENHGPEPS